MTSSLRVKVKKCVVVGQTGRTSTALKWAIRGMPYATLRADATQDLAYILRFNAAMSPGNLQFARLWHPQMPTSVRRWELGNQ